MRIVRPETTWRVLLADGREPLCLQLLAFSCGYRIKGMVEELDCSGRYVHRVFMRDVGVPPKIWMRQERMVRARHMVEGGSTNEDVAEKLGFSSAGSFRREFVAIYGLPPVEYVKAFAERAELSRRVFSTPLRRMGKELGFC